MTGILTSISLIILSSAAPKPVDVSELIAEAQNDRLGYDIIESLTTEVGPRLAGSPAEKRARDWAVKKFKELGFQKVWVDPFQVKHWERKKETAEILSPFPQPLRVTALGGSVGTRAPITGDVARFKNLEELENAPLKGFEGKILFVDEWMTRTQDGSGYGVAVRKRSGAANEAGKRKAKAALIRSVGTDHHRFPHTGQMSYQKDVRKVPIGALSAPDADQLKRALDRGKVRLKLHIEVSSRGDRESGNVIAEIPGETDEIVLIGAHLDSWDLGTGAVDDGAGVGIVMAAAKRILDLDQKPRRTLRVVLFGSEEVGLVGAYKYAEKYKDILDQHVVASESDFGAGKVWRFDTRFAENQLQLAKRFHKALKPLGIAPGTNTASGGPDIIPLREQGVPAVTLKQNGWDYFDLHHTEDDTFDKINADDIAQNVAAWAGFIWIAANMSESFRENEQKSLPAKSARPTNRSSTEKGG